MKYIERYEDTKRPIKFKDKVKIISGHHEGKIGYVGAKDSDGLPAYNIWFDDGTFDCLMSDEFIYAEENIIDLKIIAENNTGYDDVLVRYKELHEDRIVERWYKFYRTSFGRYIKIKGKRYYIDGRYLYQIKKKGDDFDFANLIVSYYDSEYSYLVLKLTKKMKLKDFKTLLIRNKGVLDGCKEILDKLNLWEDFVDEIRYDILRKEIQICIWVWDTLDFSNISKKDKKIFEELKNIYFEDNDISDDGCRCVYKDGFLLHDEEDFELYHDWALSVGLE